MLPVLSPLDEAREIRLYSACHLDGEPRPEQAALSRFLRVMFFEPPCDGACRFSLSSGRIPIRADSDMTFPLDFLW